MNAHFAMEEAHRETHCVQLEFGTMPAQPGLSGRVSESCGGTCVDNASAVKVKRVSIGGRRLFMMISFEERSSLKGFSRLRLVWFLTLGQKKKRVVRGRAYYE